MYFLELGLVHRVPSSWIWKISCCELQGTCCSWRKEMGKRCVMKREEFKKSFEII